MKDKIRRWLNAAGMRALKTMAQSAVSVLSCTAAITDVNWKIVLSTIGLAGVLSLLMSIKGLPELEKATTKRDWAICVLIRAVRTVAQSMLATIGSAVMLDEVNWSVVLASAAMTGILSVLTSIVGGIPEAKKE